MSYSNYFDYYPTLGERVYTADGAKVIGRAELGDHVNIWFNSVVRADVNFIKIGKNTNVQDLCMLHVTEQNSLTIGENTSLGHSVILHGCKIGSGCLISKIRKEIIPNDLHLLHSCPSSSEIRIPGN